MDINLKLFFMFFRIGIFGFGGGYAMLPLIFQSVQEFGFMSYEDFSDFVALSQVTPGPIAVNAATYVGFYSYGITGAAFATLGVALPSFILVLTTMFCFKKFKESKVLKGVLTGIRPAVVGLVAAAAVFMAQASIVNTSMINLTNNIQEYINILPLAIFMCTMVLIGKFKVNPIIIILLMGAIGAFTCG
jgi:chromate transporter